MPSELEQTKCSAALTSQPDDSSIISYDEFFGPRFGLHEKIRKTLENQRRLEYQNFVHLNHSIKSDKEKVSQSKSRSPLKASGSRRGLFHSATKTNAASAVKSATVVTEKPLTLVDELIENDKKKQSSASASKLTYREELALQIREKQRLQAEQREKERLADAKLNQHVAEQRRRMKEEYENELRRIKKSSLSQPNLTMIGKSPVTSQRDIKSPSYLHLKEVALARRGKSPEPNQLKCLNVNGNNELHTTSSSKAAVNRSEDSRGRRIKSPAEVTLKSSEATRKVIPLIPSVKANLAHQQHRLLVKLAGMKKPSSFSTKRGSPRDIN